LRPSTAYKIPTCPAKRFDTAKTHRGHQDFAASNPKRGPINPLS
jgi:hypothetical protein